MSPTWVNGKLLATQNKKAEKWTEPSEPDKVFWGLCPCGETIFEDDWVGMIADHERLVCYACLDAGKLPEGHLDVCGLRFPETMLSI